MHLQTFQPYYPFRTYFVFEREKILSCSSSLLIYLLVCAPNHTLCSKTSIWSNGKNCHLFRFSFPPSLLPCSNNLSENNLWLVTLHVSPPAGTSDLQTFRCQYPECCLIVFTAALSEVQSQVSSAPYTTCTSPLIHLDWKVESICTWQSVQDKYSEHVCSYIQKIIWKNVTCRTEWGEGTGESTTKDSTEERKPSLTVFITVRDVVTERATAPYQSRAAEYATSHSVIPTVHPALAALPSSSSAGGQVINITTYNAATP